MSCIYSKTILANDKEEFCFKMQKVLKDIMIEIALYHKSEVIAIQFKDIREEVLLSAVDAFYLKENGKYVYHGEVMNKCDIIELIKPYCQDISISLIPKGNKTVKRIDGEKEFGYIQYIEATNLYDDNKRSNL